MSKKLNSGSQRITRRERKKLKAASWARSSAPPSRNRRRERNNNWESELEIKHRVIWNDQNEDQQPFEFQLNQGNVQQYQKMNKGLSEEELHLLPETIADDSTTEEDCAICLEAFEKNQSLVVLICCHEFHYICCVRWLKDKKTCPICRCDQTKYDGIVKTKAPLSF